MTSIANHDDVAYWDYTGVRQFLVSLSIVSHQLKDIPMVQHALKNLNWRFPRSLKQLQIYLFPTAVFFLVGCWNKCGLWEIWNCFFDIIASRTKWLSFENSLSVIWRSIPNIPLKYINPNKASISNLSGFFFWPMCTCLIHWSYHFAANVI